MKQFFKRQKKIWSCGDQVRVWMVNESEPVGMVFAANLLNRQFKRAFWFPAPTVRSPVVENRSGAVHPIAFKTENGFIECPGWKTAAQVD